MSKANDHLHQQIRNQQYIITQLVNDIRYLLNCVRDSIPESNLSMIRHHSIEATGSMKCIKFDTCRNSSNTDKCNACVTMSSYEHESTPRWVNCEVCEVKDVMCFICSVKIGRGYLNFATQPTKENVDEVKSDVCTHMEDCRYISSAACLTCGRNRVNYENKNTPIWATCSECSNTNKEDCLDCRVKNNKIDKIKFVPPDSKSAI